MYVLRFTSICGHMALLRSAGLALNKAINMLLRWSKDRARSTQVSQVCHCPNLME
jgi:hypothetical protein